MKSIFISITLVTLTVFLIVLPGCGGTKPSKFYMLSASGNLENPGLQTTAAEGVVIGIRRIKFPDYLKRPQIVTHASTNELTIAEFDRWAEPLEDNFGRVLSQNLSSLIPTDNVLIFPWLASASIDYQIILEIIRFEREASERVSLIAVWTILNPDGKEVLLRRKSSLGEAVDKKNTKKVYEAIAVVMSRLVAELSREIAAEIQTISQEGTRK
ncbi:MAG: PqiC family protein [Candidatus Poribacteria bacterium]|nr:PqiC family protein [Candidatus Poribacteria bacterium]